MTTFEPFSEISSDIAYDLSRRPETRPHFPLMAIFHFCAISGVALVCYLFVHH